MVAWHALVTLLSLVLSTLTIAYGGSLGLAIITLSLLTRLALLPLTLSMARHSEAQQRILHSLRREIEQLQTKYRLHPRKLAAELNHLYQKHGAKPVSGANLLGVLVQLVLGAGVYSAIVRGLARGSRFLWIRNLTQPNALLAVITGIVAGLASLMGPHLPQQSRVWLTLCPALLTVILGWRLASGVVLYWAASSAVSGFQALLLRRKSQVIATRASQ